MTKFAVYFSSRDERGRAQIGRLDLNLAASEPVTRVYPEPVVDFGPLGAFEDFGVTSGCLVHHERKKHQYYSGWWIGVAVPFISLSDSRLAKMAE